MRSEKVHKEKSRWIAPPCDPLLELKWGLALLGKEGRTEYLAWLKKNKSDMSITSSKRA